MSAVIETHELTKHYGRHLALHGISVSVEEGRVFGVIGPNGAGKTTVMRVLLDIIRRSGGDVRVLGLDPRVAGPTLRRRIGYLPGELMMDARVSARAMLRHFAELNGGVAVGRIESLADRLGLDLSRTVRALSKGNKQKVGLVQAFMHSPELLVLDEPTSGLDPLVQREFLAMVRDARDAGQTVFLSSHVISEIQHAADDVAVLRDGRIVDISTVERFRAAARRSVRVVVRRTDFEALRAALTLIAAYSETRVTHDEDRVTVHGHLGDGVAQFVAAVTANDPLDLVVQEPDLEGAVIGLYRDDASATKEREQ